MFRKLILAMLIVLTLTVWVGRDVGRFWGSGLGHRGGDGVPTVEMVRELSELTTLRVVLADVRTTRLDGWTGGAEADLLVRGDFTVATDLGAARFASVDPASRTAVLILPQPRASVVRVDHRTSRVVSVHQTGVWAVLPGDDAAVAVVDLAYKDAERTLSGVGGEDDRHREYLSTARRRTEDVLGTFFERLGWSVAVQWE